MRCKVAVATGWCALCYAGVRGRQRYQGHAGFTRVLAEEREAVAMGFLRRADAAARAGASSPPSFGAGLEGMFPAILEFMSVNRWEDGKPRKTGTVLVVFEDNVWKAWIHDRDQKRSAWLSGSGFYELCESVEAGLQGDVLLWRVDKR